jgi:hypothetical protein
MSVGDQDCCVCQLPLRCRVVSTAAARGRWPQERSAARHRVARVTGGVTGRGGATVSAHLQSQPSHTENEHPPCPLITHAYTYVKQRK